MFLDVAIHFLIDLGKDKFVGKVERVIEIKDPANAPQLLRLDKGTYTLIR